MPTVLQTKNRLFYGWVIVAASLIIVSTIIGIRFSFGVFFKSLQAEFDITRAVTSSVVSVFMIFNAVFGIVTGWALDRYGPRLLVGLMGLLAGLSLILTGQTVSFWQIFLSYSLLLALGTGGTVPVLTSVTSRWFSKKRGIAIGIVSSGIGLGTLVVAPLAAYLISNFGWRMSFMVLGLVTWLVVVSLALLLRRDPAEIGALPDGVKPGADRPVLLDREDGSQPTGLSLPQALRTRSFWILLAVWLSWPFCITLIMTHLVPYATDLKISTIEASTILSVMSGFQILSRLLVGRVSDSVGRKIPGIICALLGSVSLIGLIWIHELQMFYLFAISFGLAYGGISVVNLTLTSDSFRGRNLGIIMGVMNVGYSVGAAIGSFLGGFIFDVTGSYVIAFEIGAAVMLVTALLVALTGRETDTRHPYSNGEYSDSF